MSNSNAKGDRRERELVNELDAAGYAVMRAPASGSATERELPDVLAGDGEDFYAVEAKSSGGDPIYLTGEEVEALLFFSRNFGAKPRIAVRFDREAWYFFHPGDDAVHTTDGGNYRVKKETALAHGTDFDELVGRSEKVTLDEVAGTGDADAGDADAGDAGDDGVDDGGSGVGPGGRSAGDGPSQATLEVLAAFERGDLSKEDAAEMLD